MSFLDSLKIVTFVGKDKTANGMDETQRSWQSLFKEGTKGKAPVLCIDLTPSFSFLLLNIHAQTKTLATQCPQIGKGKTK